MLRAENENSNYYHSAIGNGYRIVCNISNSWNLEFSIVDIV